MVIYSFEYLYPYLSHYKDNTIPREYKIKKAPTEKYRQVHIIKISKTKCKNKYLMFRAMLLFP